MGRDDWIRNRRIRFRKRAEYVEINGPDGLAAGDIAVIISQKSPTTHIELPVLIFDKIRPTTVSYFNDTCCFIPLFGGVMLHPYFVPHSEIGEASSVLVSAFSPSFMKEVTC